MNFYKRIISKMINNCSIGSIDLTFHDGDLISKINNDKLSKCDISFLDIDGLKLIISEGSIGFAKGYISNKWQTSNLTDLLIFVSSNRQHIENTFYGNMFFKIFSIFKNAFIFNSKKKSKTNIKFHYDLGNDFYSKWLDESMTYSSALFKKNNDSLEVAQKNKYLRIIKNIKKYSNKNNIVEIGCGWGGFYEQAKKSIKKLEYTGVTISEKQYQFLKEKNENKNDIEFLFRDYRDLKGKFTSVISIEMFEALGYKQWKLFFKKINEILVDGGLAIIQTITINNKIFDNYIRTNDFIREFIFPGGLLPSPNKFKILVQNNGFELLDEFYFGKDYAKTLSIWQTNFNKNFDYINSIKFDIKFKRLWNFYLSYCQAGFISGDINVCQYKIRKVH